MNGYCWHLRMSSGTFKRLHIQVLAHPSACTFKCLQLPQSRACTSKHSSPFISKCWHISMLAHSSHGTSCSCKHLHIQMLARSITCRPKCWHIKVLAHTHACRFECLYIQVLEHSSACTSKRWHSHVLAHSEQAHSNGCTSQCSSDGTLKCLH